MSSNLPTKKILILAANPQGTEQLRLDQEMKRIQAELRPAIRNGQITVQSRWAVTPDDFRNAMLDYDPQIVHFSGHGAGKPGLAFEGNNGEIQLVEAEALSNLFSLFEQVECVVMNACYSEAQAESIARHIGHVIGMSQAIGDEASIKFSAGFYDGVGSGKSYEVAYKLGCTSIQLYSLPDHLIPILKKKL